MKLRVKLEASNLAEDSFEIRPKGRVSSLLIGVQRSDATWPLAQFQSTLYEYSDVLRLIKSINAASDSPLETVSLERAFRAWWTQLKEQVDEAVENDAKKKSSTVASRSNEDMLHDLLDLTRTQQKFLSDMADSRLTIQSANVRPKIIRDVDFGEVQYYLKRILSAGEEAVELGKPETPTMVKLRALIMLLTKILFPAPDDNEGQTG